MSRLPKRKYVCIWCSSNLYINELKIRVLQNTLGNPDLATFIWVTSISISQDWGDGSWVHVSARLRGWASGGVTCCIPPLRPPSLPCWGSFAGRRPGTRFAGMRAPIWTGCDASSCWRAQSRRHRTAQAPGSVDWTLERETAADPDCFCLSYFQNSGLSGWILKRERSRFDRVCSLHLADRQTDEQKHLHSSPLSFAICCYCTWGCRGEAHNRPPHCPPQVTPPKPPLSFLWRSSNVANHCFKSNLLLLFSISSLAWGMKQHGLLNSCILMSRGWTQSSVRSREKLLKGTICS